jgi:hypothetical protein
LRVVSTYRRQRYVMGKLVAGIPLTQIPKLGCEIDQIHAAFSVSESNFGEVGGGQRKRLLNSGFRCE